MDYFKMYIFHLRMYGQQSYFLGVVVLNTVGIMILRYLSCYGHQEMLSSSDVIMASAFGLWNSAVTSAGILHFQRTQGVLGALINQSKSPLTAVMALVASSASFGLLALPLASASAFLLNGGRVLLFKENELLGLILFWIAALSISCVLATLFLLTSNAFVYEGVLVVPLLLLSGLFGNLLPENSILEMAVQLVPIHFPLMLIRSGGYLSVTNLFIWLISILFWMFAGFYFFKKIVYKVRVKGDLEVF